MEQSQGTGAVGGALQGAAAGSAFGAPGAIVGGVIGGVTGFLGGGGEKKAKKAAKRQAAEILRAAKENKRVQERQASLSVDMAKARTYASNIQDTGSTKAYRKDLEAEYRRAIDYDFSAAQRAAEETRKSGKAAANSIQRAGLGQLLQGATAAGGAAASSGLFASDSGSVLKDKAGSFAKTETSSSPGYINF